MTPGQIAMIRARAAHAVERVALLCQGVEVSRDSVLEAVRKVRADVDRMAEALLGSAPPATAMGGGASC